MVDFSKYKMTCGEGHNNRFTKAFTINTKENYSNFEKSAGNAIAMDIGTAKEVTKAFFDKLKQSGKLSDKKSYEINFLYADRWRSSRGFNIDEPIKFIDEEHTDYNANSNLYDYIYAIQIREVPKKYVVK